MVTTWSKTDLRSVSAQRKSCFLQFKTHNNFFTVLVGRHHLFPPLRVFFKTSFKRNIMSSRFKTLLLKESMVLTILLFGLYCTVFQQIQIISVATKRFYQLVVSTSQPWLVVIFCSLNWFPINCSEDQEVTLWIN